MNAIAEIRDSEARTYARRIAWAIEDADWQEVGRLRREALALGIDAEALAEAETTEAG